MGVEVVNIDNQVLVETEGHSSHSSHEHTHQLQDDMQWTVGEHTSVMKFNSFPLVVTIYQHTLQSSFLICKYKYFFFNGK